ncbi:MAG TPA: hypothetical protein VMV03_04520 [Spirochaetia bacterium]|nr:hypothetical protein [Spirochaetia bacterium]
MRCARDGFVGWLGGFWVRRFSRIREINRRYAVPHVKMTRGVRVALLLLRIYLLLLVGILFFKFFTLLAGK